MTGNIAHLLDFKDFDGGYVTFGGGAYRGRITGKEASTNDNGEFQITATIDGHSMSITEASLRRHLKLDDQDGVTSIPNSEIFEQLALMGYHNDSDKLTFQKGAFSPQWSCHQTQPSTGAEHHLSTPLDSPLHADHSYGSDEGNLKLNELMNLVTKLSQRIGVLEDDLRKTKKTYILLCTKPSKVKEVRVLESILGKQEKSISEKGVLKLLLGGWFFGATKGTASEVPVVSTAEENISTAGRTSEPKKKSKKEIEQERLSFAEAIRLEEQMNEEQRAQIARDEEIARQWDEEERQRAMSEAKASKKIDWNDPSVIRYHALKMKPKIIAQARRNMIKYLKNQGNYKISDFKGMSYNEIRPIFEKVWDFNQHIEPMDMEHGSEKMKSPEKIEEEDVDTQKEMKEVVKESGAKRKKSLPRKRRTVKRQKLEEDAEKEELKGFLDIIPREDVAEDVESLSTKYPIVDWKTYTLTENFMYYQIFRGDGSSKNYKVLSEILKDFDRQDVQELYRLNGIAIHILTEKKYPLSQEMISKMLKKKLEVDHESSQAFELLSTNGVSTASTYLVLPELVNTARRKINTADGQSC
ncbi:hypothetical protein Tco_1338787 [Tanacetum coccineum]